jgi:hypothetical protein
VLGRYFSQQQHNDSSTPPSNIRQAFQCLPTALQNICGTSHFPDDNGVALMHHISESGSLYCMSDTSVKNGRASHAWIISSGEVDLITDPTLTIFVSGLVDGYSPYISSTRAELTGITAISVIMKLLMEFQSSKLKVQISCDNKGIISKIPHMSITKFCAHREANFDLFSTQQDQIKHFPITYS